jgi:hypothetical protein
MRALAAAGKLLGDYLGYDYRIDDDRAELLFRISAAAFRQRNFARHGVHNRYMGLGHSAKLLEDLEADDVPVVGRATCASNVIEQLGVLSLDEVARRRPRYCGSDSKSTQSFFGKRAGASWGKLIGKPRCSRMLCTTASSVM